MNAIINSEQQTQLLQQELQSIRERYLRLADLHGKLQVQNGILEERVLSLVETSAQEKRQLEQALDDAEQQIIYLQDTVQELQIDKQRYKDDCNLAVRLLHRYPNDFVATTSEQVQEQLKTRHETSTATPRALILPTFPPTFVAPPTFLTTPSNTSSTHSTSTAENLRLTAEALFKSNSVDRFPSMKFVCSHCHRSVRCSDASVQTSLDPNHQSSRLRLVSLSASDDGNWLSFDSHPSDQGHTQNDNSPLSINPNQSQPITPYSTSNMYYV